MKLLFDHNLSPRLVQRLADLCPDSTHVYTIDVDFDAYLMAFYGETKALLGDDISTLEKELKELEQSLSL